MKWPRLCEGALGLWLIASVWVFDVMLGHVAVAAACLGGISVLAAWHSYRRPGSRLHWGTSVCGVILVLMAGVEWPDPPPLHVQNGMVCGMVLVILGCLPTGITQPPRSWAICQDQDPDQRRSERQHEV